MNVDKILVPTDFSECADSALQVAVGVAKKVGAEIHLLHSTNSLFDWVKEDHMSFESGVLPNNLSEGMMKGVNEGVSKAQGLLEQSCEEVRSEGIKAEGHLRINLTHKEITDFCREEEIGMIIMGSKGTSGFVGEMMGSNAQKIARSAKCPVIFVKNPPEEFEIKKILFPSTFEEEEEVNNLHFAKAFAELYGAKLDLLFVNTPHYFEETEDSRKRLNEIISSYGLENSEGFIYNHFTPEDGILAFTEQNGYDLICMSKYQYSGWKRLSKPFVTEPVINHSDAPVMSIYVKKD